MKRYLLVILFLTQISLAVDLNDLKEPKPLLGRSSNLDKIEVNIPKNIKTESKKALLVEQPKIIEKIQEEIKKEVALQTPAKDITQEEEASAVETIAQTTQNYADLSLKRLADDISIELERDALQTSSDLNVLWQAATEKSETIKYTIYKLSNPDEDKPDQSAVKKILKPIANFSSLIGASVAADPYVATGALIGGGIAGAFMKDDKEINYQFSKVSDTDMVLLIRKIDELQKRMLDLYIDFKTKEKIALATQEDLIKKEETYKNMQNSSKEELVLADMYYRNAKIKAQKAQDEILIAKTILENLVGTEAVKQITEK